MNTFQAVCRLFLFSALVVLYACTRDTDVNTASLSLAGDNSGGGMGGMGSTGTYTYTAPPPGSWITFNMHGATTAGESIWHSQVAPLAAQSNVVMLQECGRAPGSAGQPIYSDPNRGLSVYLWNPGGDRGIWRFLYHWLRLGSVMQSMAIVATFDTTPILIRDPSDINHNPTSASGLRPVLALFDGSYLYVNIHAVSPFRGAMDDTYQDINNILFRLSQYRQNNGNPIVRTGGDWNVNLNNAEQADFLRYMIAWYNQNDNQSLRLIEPDRDTQFSSQGSIRLDYGLTNDTDPFLRATVISPPNPGSSDHDPVVIADEAYGPPDGGAPPPPDNGHDEL